MRRIAFVCIAALLAGCGQKSAEAPQTSAPQQQAANAAAFPALFQASYRADVTINRDGGAAGAAVMIGSGRKLRVEMARDEGPLVVIVDTDTHEAIMIVDAGGHPMAFRMQDDAWLDVVQNWQGDLARSARAVGPCSAAGEEGAEWERQDESGDVGSVCVTGDGIILRTTKNGRTAWEMTRLRRGPQDAALFAPPAGVRVTNVNPGAAAMLQRMQAKKP